MAVTKGRRMTVRQLASAYGHDVGCIDNSCVFGAPKGMATNGGCRCLRDCESPQDAARLVRRIVAILASIADGPRQ